MAGGRDEVGGEGDCLVHLVEEQTHTLRAGPDGLDVLAFGTRRPSGGTYLPRAGVVRMGPGNAVARDDKHPWELEAEAGPPEVGDPSERPQRIVALADVVPEQYGRGSSRAGPRQGSVSTGISHVELSPGERGLAAATPRRRSSSSSSTGRASACSVTRSTRSGAARSSPGRRQPVYHTRSGRAKRA